MYDKSTALINPDPSKYAFCEGGIQRLPRQCRGCKGLFTPVNDNQSYCEYCCPDPKVVTVVSNKIKQERKSIKRADPVKKTAYNLFLTNSRSRRNTQLKKETQLELQSGIWFVTRLNIVTKTNWI